MSAALAIGIGLAGSVGIAPGVVPAAATQPVHVAIAVPLTVPSGSGALLDADSLETLTSESGLLTRQLDAVINRPVTLAIDPRIIVSIRVLGSAAPPSASAWLDRLAGASNQSFSLTWADSDLTLPTQAGSGMVLRPEGFDFAIDPQLFSEPLATSSFATPTPTPTREPPNPGSSKPPLVTPPTQPTVPSLPTSDELASWPFTLPGIAWPRAGTVVTSDLPIISASGYSTTILASSNMSPDSAPRLTATVGDSAVLVSDSASSSALRSATVAVDSAQFQVAVDAAVDAISSAAAAQLALAQSSGANASDTPIVFATLDRVAAGRPRLADTLAALQADPNISMVGLAAAMDTPSETGALVDSPQDSDRVTAMQQLLAAEAADARFAEIAADPSRIIARKRLELLALVSNAWTTRSEGWSSAVRDSLAASQEFRSSVQVEVEGDFQFFAAATAPLTIPVSNDLDQPVTVYVTVRPDTGLLSVRSSSVEVVIEPGSQATAKVPAQAVSNGVVAVSITLTSATGAPVGNTARATINVQAGWETPVVIVIASLVVLIFGGGLLRNILRTRRSRTTPGNDS